MLLFEHLNILSMIPAGILMNWDVAILCLLYLSMFGSGVLYHLYMSKDEAVIARLHGVAGTVWCALYLGYPQHTKELTVW